jgi:type I restriction enzyme S subunit
MAVGKVAFPAMDLAINQDLKAIKCKSQLDKKFLFYVLKSKSDYFNNISTGATVKGIKIAHITDLKIPLPPLEQQKKIVSILDAADELRQKDKALIAKYDELTQSLFLDMFGDPVKNEKAWEIKKLGNVCLVGSSKRVFVEELVEEGIPFYRGTEVGKLGEGKAIRPTLFITKEHYEKLKDHRGVPKKGDLLMPSICPDGRIWVVDNDTPFYFKDGRVLWVEVDSKNINSIYLRYHLKGSFFANYSNIASGTTFAELKIVALKKMDIFYPELKLQNQFAERVKAIETQKVQAQESLKKSEELFNSLLQRAFKAEVV